VFVVFNIIHIPFVAAFGDGCGTLLSEDESETMSSTCTGMSFGECHLLDIVSSICAQPLTPPPPLLLLLPPLSGLGIIEISFVIDIIFCFHTAYESLCGKIVTDRARIGSNYFKSWFFLDLVTVIPFDLIVRATIDNNVNEWEDAINYIRCIRLARIVRVFSLFSKLRTLETSSYSKIWRIFKLVFVFLIVSHWICCFLWIVFYKSRGLDTIAVEDGGQEDGGTSTNYIHFLYIASNILVGERVQYELVKDVDFWVAFLAMITGAICYASFFGWVAVLIGKLDRSSARRNDLNVQPNPPPPPPPS
jgi:hypothetical protein